MAAPARYAVFAACGVLLIGGCTDRERERNLLEVARAFPAPASWSELTATNAAEPVCVGADCVTIVMRWSTPDRPVREELRGLMSQAGWETIEINSCEPRPRTTGSFPFCRATAERKGANVELTVSGPQPNGVPWNVTLRVR